jgi:hypothetical protein
MNLIFIACPHNFSELGGVRVITHFLAPTEYGLDDIEDDGVGEGGGDTTADATDPDTYERF